MDSTNTNKIHQRLNFWNIFWLIFALILSAVVFLKYKIDRTDFLPEYFIYLSVGIPTILLVFQYIQLRKKSVFRTWCLLTLVLFAVSFKIAEDSSLLLNSGRNAALNLKAPFLFLINYFVFSKLAKKFYDTELILPPRYSKYDAEEGRSYNIYDYLAVIVGFFVIIASGMF